MNEGFLIPMNERDERESAAVLDALRSGRDAVVTSIECGFEPNRAYLVQLLARNAPGTRILWHCIENNLEVANSNCDLDPNRSDGPGRKLINACWSPRYTIPHDATVLPIHDLRGVVAPAGLTWPATHASATGIARS